MRIVEKAADIKGVIDTPIMALGVFDGVHIGHQKILQQVVARARERRGSSVLLSFAPHPQKIISSGSAPPLLQTFSQQAELLEGIGIDVLVRYPFTRSLSLLSPEAFVRDVLCPFKVREIHVGANFRFGHQRSGDFEQLQALGNTWDFSVQRTEQVFFRGARVSSTRIRRTLGQGRVALAGRLLGRPYEVRGDVVRGAGNGATLGFPTANLKVDNELLPPTGVYITRVNVVGRTYFGATNIGFRPTVHGYTATLPTVETFIHGFAGNLYGQSMSLEFCLRLRDEKQFSALDELMRQIRLDIR